MKNELVTVRNTETGRVGRMRRRLAEHAIYGLYFEIVPDGSKDFVDLSEYRGSSAVLYVEDETPEPEEDDE